MNKTMKVAKWEIKRNMRNKSFVIGLFLTPILFVVFAFIGSLFGSTETDEMKVLIKDEIGAFNMLEESVQQYELNMQLQLTDLDKKEIRDELQDEKNTAYLVLNEEVINTGVVPVYGEDLNAQFENQIQILAEPLKMLELSKMGITTEQLEAISKPILFKQQTLGDMDGKETEESMEDTFKDAAPGVLAGILLFSIVITGMMIFTSASQEKKDKIAEIILSSVTPTDLMQGKIIGYFVLGMIQSLIILLIAVPYAIYSMDFPILKYLLVPETLLFVFVAVLGYLLFAAIFVGIGATMADMSTAGNFQGMVMMLPFLPLIFITPVVSDPNGLWAQIGTYIPFSSPGVLILRLSMLEEWPWSQIIIALVLLMVSIWLFMKLAGKIFKVGILMYGKNATPAEIWKWIRA